MHSRQIQKLTNSMKQRLDMRVLPETLIVTQLVKKFPVFYGTQSFICSQNPVTGLCAKVDKSIPHPCALFP